MNEDINHHYYAHHAPGRLDYWKKMAAPRFRSKAIIKFLRNFNFKSLIDLGCGSGMLLEEVSKRFPETQFCGIDSSAQQIERNKKAMPQFKWDIFDLEKKEPVSKEFSNAFDIALCSEVIEHLDHPEILLGHAKAFTKNNTGILILTTQSGRIGETEKRVGHKQHFSKEIMGHLLKSSGWEILHMANAGFPFHDLSKWLANRNPDQTMEQFSEKPYGLWENWICWMLRFAFLLNSNTTGAQLFAVARKKVPE